jgi:tetratricopeptide (TPR) repeat protein
MFEQAIEAHRKAVASFQGFAFPVASLGHAFALAGQKEQAHKLLAELEEISTQKFVSAYLRAVVYAGLGENDRAFEWLEKAWLERSWFLIFLKVEPIFDPLRSDPRFADLVRRVNLYIVIRVR